MPQLKSLLMCRTPLQAIIVNKLINQYSLNSFVVYYPTGLSKKHKSYFDAIKGKKVFIKPRFFNTYILSELFFFVAIAMHIRQYTFKDCFYASIGGVASGLILKKFPKDRVFTFDDGTFNIKPNFFSEWIYNESKKLLFYKKILGLPTNAELIKGITKHYTIYDPSWNNFNNIKIVKLDIWSSRKSLGLKHERKKILLGTTLESTKGSIPETDEGRKRIEVLKNFIVDFDFDLYIPHPAEGSDSAIVRGFSEKESFEIHSFIESNIAEDVVLNLKKLGYDPVLYGFGSTALINLSNDVEVYHVSFPDFGGESEMAAQMMQFNIKSMIVNK
jgi:hypothetical protein